MAGYAKLHSGILDSSIWSADVYTRVVWVAMLAKADADGRVMAAPSRMVEICNVPQSRFDRAIEKLSGPDPESKTPDHEGRRIVQIQGGWQILNYKKYRDELESEERKEYKRQWDRDHRPSGFLRSKSQSDRQSDSSPTQSDQSYVSRSISKGISIKERDIERKPTPPKKNLFLEFVYLTEEEHQKLIERLGDKDTRAYIERLNNYLGSKGKKYKSHYHTILNWSNKDANDTNHAGKSQSHSAAPRRDFDAQQSAIGETINVDQ